jgi:putative tryptophan/tyrosine transport system substrate-binding protein
MRRRDFIKGVAGSAITWPLAALAHQSSQIRRVGVLMNFPSADPEGQARMAVFKQALSKLGWIEGGNLQTEIRWAGDNPDLYRRYAVELVALTPDVILASGGQSVEALQRVTRSMPIIFTNVIDPIGEGFINSLSRPGGNTTGFLAFEYSISGKWLDLLRELAPAVKRAAVLRDPSYAACIGQFAAIQSATSSSGMELSAIDERDAGEIERAITAFAREANGGVIITASSASVANRNIIISLLTRYRLPNVYPFKYYPMGGGLASYGPDTTELLPTAAVYLDRILKGEKPANLPVQAPTKYELVINLKTARALGLNVPQTLLARADEVIE